MKGGAGTRNLFFVLFPSFDICKLEEETGIEKKSVHDYAIVQKGPTVQSTR